MATASGVGFTVIVKFVGVPTHTPSVGVTVMVANVAALVALVATNDAIFPLPLAARPILVLLLVQSYVEVGLEPLKLIAVVGAPLHTV